MDDTREEMRKLIDVIEKGSKSASIEQAVEDIKTFANTASYLANALDTRLKQNDAKPKANKRSAKATGAHNTKALARAKTAGQFNRHAQCDQYSHLASRL